MAHYYPICLSLDGRQALVVGGGAVACRKVESLLAAGARVTVVSPEIYPELRRLDGVRLVERPFEEADVSGAAVVFAATDDAAVNHRVAVAARARGALVNVVDTPAECDFIVPSTLVRGDLTISVSTGSAAPALSRRLRLELEALFPEAYADYVALLADLRHEVLREVSDPACRREILLQLADRPAWNAFARHGPSALRQLARELIDKRLGGTS